MKRFWQRSLLIVCLFFSSSLLLWFYQSNIFSIQNHHILNVDDLILSGTQQKSLVIPSVQTFLRQLHKNTDVKKFLSSEVAEKFFQSPPLFALHYLFDASNSTIGKIGWALLKKIFDGSLYYVSSNKGYALIIASSSTSVKLYKKIINSRRVIRFDRYLIIASDRQIENQIKEKLLSSRASYNNSKKSFAFKYYIRGDETKSSDLIISAWQTLFPAKYFSLISVSGIPDKKGISISSKFEFTEEGQSYFSQKNNSNFLYPTKEIANLQLEFKLSPDQMIKYFQKENTKLTSGVTSIVSNQFYQDYGLLLPNFNIVGTGSSKILDELFHNVLSKQKYSMISEHNITQKQFIRYQYRNYKSYFNFSPVLVHNSKFTMLSSSKKEFKNYKEKTNSKLEQKKSNKITLAINKKTIAYIKFDILNYLSQSQKELRKINPVYLPQAYGDFIDFIPQLKKYFSQIYFSLTIDQTKYSLQSHGRLTL